MTIGKEKRMTRNRSILTLNALNAYALVEAARSSLVVGTLGLGVSGHIQTIATLSSFITIEAFCALLNLVVIVNEAILIRSDAKLHTTECYIYLCFRLFSVFSSLIGLSLMSVDLFNHHINGNKIVIGTILVALGLFISHALNVLQKDWDKTIKIKNGTL
jgi:hypothetical protein